MSWPIYTAAPAAVQSPSSSDRHQPGFPGSCCDEVTGSRPLLDNKGPDGTETPKSQSWRYRVQPMVRRLLLPTDGTKGPSVCYCSRYAAKRAGGASVECAEVHRTARRRLKLVGLQRCGSAWLCSICTVSHARRQWQKTERALKRLRAIGGVAVMVTNTLGRDLDEDLADVKAALQAALVAARQTRSWKAAKKSGLLLGAMPFIEVLHNLSFGWHPHSHSLMFFKGLRSEIEPVLEAYQAAYMANLRAKGRRVDPVAQDVSFIETDEDLARYISKSNASWEVSGGVKAARSRQSRSFFDLLYLADAGDADAARLARQYAEVMPGTQSGVLSPQLAKNLGLGEDDDEVSDDGEPDSDLLGVVHVDVMVRVANYGHLADLNDAVEACEGWSTLEDRLFEWARCSEDERDCYRDLLAGALKREER